MFSASEHYYVSDVPRTCRCCCVIILVGTDDGRIFRARGACGGGIGV
jgi:hypothetical protein